MAQTIISLNCSQPFDFTSTVDSHGWVELLPNEYHSEDHTFSRIEELPSGKIVQMHVFSENDSNDGSVAVDIRHKGKLSKTDIGAIKNNVEHMLRMDEDFSAFYALCRKKGKPWSSMSDGKGRLLRSSDLFEEIVKVICTTNIQWGGTKRMVRELVTAYGTPFELDPEKKTFPRPEVIAAVPFEEFQEKVHMGYRTAYVHSLAIDVAENPSSLQFLRDSSLITEEVKKKLLAIKGIGNYAAASLLMLVGRYENVPVDSVFRQLMRDKYFSGNEFELADALALYDEWGKWKHLAYWFDLLNYYHPS